MPFEVNENEAEVPMSTPFTPMIPARAPVLDIASPSPSNSFIGLDDIPMADSSYIIIPPDVGGGVGPTRVMDTHNNNYRVQDKTTGATIVTVGTATFWNPVVANKALLNQLTDPRTTYDPIQNRWIVCMQTVNNPGLILFGVSQTSDPAGSWFLYAVTPGFTGAPRLDFPIVGFNKNWLVVTINAYTSAGAFSRGGTMIASYPLAAAGTLASVTNVTQASGSHFCTAPCVTVSATEDTLYLVTHLSSGTGTYVVDRITGTASPTYTTGTTTTRPGGGWVQPSGNQLPQSAPNAGASSCGATACLIETQDSQVRSAPMFRVDATTGRQFIYYAQTIGLPSTGQTHTAVQWTKLTASTTAPVFADGGRIEDATATATNGGKWYAYPHIAANSTGDFIVGYSQFSSAQHPSAGYSYHNHIDGLGTMRDPLIYKAGEDYYHKDFGSGRNRWGDFTTAQVDPSDDQTLWVLQEYAKTRTGTDDGTTGSNSSKWSNYWAAVSAGTTFTITATAGAGGSISPSGAVSVSQGANQTFTITANSCFSIQDVQVDGVSQGAINSFTFANVQAAHTINATFVQNGPYMITASAGANGSISPNGATSVTCGSSQAYTITPNSCYSIQNVLVDGVSQGAIASYTFTNVTGNHTIAASFVHVAAVVPAPAAVSATQVLLGNPAGSRTGIVIHFGSVVGAASYKVYRAPYGHYPEYDDNGGAAPVAPTTWPPAAPWALTGVTADGGTDTPPTRDFWYYVVYAENACGDVSVASAMTGGTLDYHLGDVSDNVTPGTGDNLVDAADISLLGAHYGINLAPNDPYDYLDVGPTSTNYVDGRPLTDDRVDFEDLVMFAINFGEVTTAARTTPPAKTDATLATKDELTLFAPAHVAPGDDVAATLSAQGTGLVQALSVRLTWNPDVVALDGATAGALLAGQNGVLLSATPGTFDFAVLGTDQALVGAGTLATVRFKVIAAGDPGIDIAGLDARDTRNRKVVMGASRMVEQAAPTVTTLQPVAPNPSRGTATLSFSLAQRGLVDVSIYSVDGRLVRTLLHVGRPRRPRRRGRRRSVLRPHDDGSREVHAHPHARAVARDHVAGGSSRGRPPANWRVPPQPKDGSMRRPFTVSPAVALARAAGVALALALFVRAPAARAVTVSVSPADTTVDIGNTFTLRVVCDAFPALKAYQLRFGFNAAVIQFVGASAGDVLTSTGRAFSMQVVPDVTAPTDTAHVDCAQLVGATAGPGVLVYFTFNAVAAGETPIACDGADFRDPFNVQTLPGCAPGHVRVVPPTATRAATWGGVKDIYR
jgi:hypothetical protein